MHDPFFSPLFDKTMFLVFVLLGLFQLAIAAEAGYLAVLALPDGVKRPVHKRIVAFCCLALLALTLGIGKLNDTAAREADEKAKNLQTSMGETNASFTKLDKKSDDIAAKFDEFSKSPSGKTKQFTDLQTSFLSFRSELNAAKEKAQGLPISSPAVPSITSPPISIPNVQPGTPTIPNPPLKTQLESLAYEMEDIYTGSQQRHSMAARGYLMRTLPVENRKAAYDDAAMSLFNLVDGQTKAYMAKRQEVMELRTKALNIVELSPSLRSQDEAAFTSLDKNLTTVPIPLKANDPPTQDDNEKLSSYGFSYQFDGMAHYLRDLAAKLP